MEKVQYAIEIVNRWSSPMNSFERRIDAVNSKKIGSPVNNDFHNGIGKANSGLHQTSHNLMSAGSGASMFSKALQVLPAIGAAAVIYKIGSAAASFTKDSIMAAAAVEKYTVTLKTMLGSQGAARDRMQEYFDIAAKTPFQLDQVIQAGNQLQAIGQYSRENLTTLGDLAAASGKPLEQVMGAYAKLATGQKGESVNMFRDLLISVEDWTKATGKGVKSNGELEASTDEMLKALPAILKAKGFMGMMGEQAQTTEGQLSNLKDSTYQLKVALGDKLKPSFDSLIQTGSGVVEMFKDWVEVPIEQKIAQEKAQLNSLVESLIDANDNEDIRKRIILEIQQKYPEFIGNIDMETASTAQLRDRLEEVNAQYDAKMRKMSIQRRINNMDEEIADVEEKIDEINAVQMDYTLAKEKESNLKAYLPRSGIDAQGNTINYLDNQGNINWGSANQYFKGLEDSPNNVDAYVAYQEYLAYTEAYQGSRLKVANQWGTDDMGELDRELMVLQTKRKMWYEQLISDVDSVQDMLSADATNDNDDASGGSGGGSGGNFDLSKAEDTISGGGRNLKVINISLESLIANNTNIFEPGKDPADANEFLDKLSAALQLVVNDTNYNTQ
jgi:hypothetical protein